MLVYQFQRSYKNLETLNEGQNFERLSSMKWDKAFKNGPSKIFGR